MARRIIAILIALAIVGAVAGWFLTAPRPLSAENLPEGYEGDPVKGEYVFWAGGCASCHAAPCADSPGLTCAANDEEKLRLTGGITFATPFGTFYAPNISPDPAAGIGGWSTLEFVNAMKLGITPDGSHYYPALPYASYQRMSLEDLIDLKAFMDTLPPISEPAREHEVAFPFNIRRGLGMWKMLAVDGETFTPDPERSDAVNRGAYLVNGPGHCGECHTPRALFGIDTLLGVHDHSRWLGGAPDPEGRGVIPNITPDPSGIGSWSEGDIAYALESGFTPEYDTLGGTMKKVQEGTAHLSKEDREAIAAYLKSLPAVAAPSSAE